MSLGLVSRASPGLLRVIGIADQGVVWTRASSGQRRVIGVADQGVVWAAPCHWYG